MGTHLVATGTRRRDTLHNRGTHRREPTLPGRILLHLGLTLPHLGHTLHSSMGTLRPVATHSTVAIPLPVTPARPRRTMVMGVATAGAVDTWERC